jgi:hypothetical protein
MDTMYMIKIRTPFGYQVRPSGVGRDRMRSPQPLPLAPNIIAGHENLNDNAWEEF